jgi:hypothetical protein
VPNKKEKRRKGEKKRRRKGEKEKRRRGEEERRREEEGGWGGKKRTIFWCARKK